MKSFRVPEARGFARRADFSFGRHTNFHRGGERFPGKSRSGPSKTLNPALAARALWAMDGGTRPANSGFSPRPLPLIGVRRAIVQCRAHDDDRAAPAVALGPENPMASAFQPPTPEQGVFSGGAGYRWTHGLWARNPCAIVIQPVHTRVDSCGLPPRAIRRKPTSR